MPVLPIIDLLILMGWTSLFGAFALKAIYVTTSYHPSLFGLGPLDLTILSAVMLLFALAVSARTWVKSLERSGLSPNERAAATLEAYSQIQAETARPISGPSAEEGPPADRTPRGPRSAIGG
jgi:hypothetical protein